MREFNHMCEIYSNPWSVKLWTKPSGLCWISSDGKYQDPSVNMENVNLSDDDKCIYFIRCALSGGLESSCPCNGINCTEVMRYVCKEGHMYLYPSKGMIRPWIHHYYKRNRTWTDPTPDLFMVIGSIKCRGYRVVSNKTTWLSLVYDLQLVFKRQIENSFCRSDSANALRETESALQYPVNCWNDTRTFNNRSYAFYDVCRHSRECISQYRIGDGILDCWDDQDEEFQVVKQTNYCFNLRKHRFQCSPSQMTCLPISMLSTVIARCENKNDVFVKGGTQSTSEISCQRKGDSGCLFLRYYIGNSSNLNSTLEADITNNSMQGVPITPYHFHCDSFWNEQSHMDENRNFCQEWICYDNRYQCQSGQCIDLSWVCDGQWDCSDASDEEAIALIKQWSSHNQRLLGLDERKQECASRYSKSKMPFSDLCNLSAEYPCYLASVLNPLDIHTYRPCINLIQIGDGIVNCYGGIDEKNTLEDCHGRMLGYTLRCDNSCVQYLVACDTTLPCSNSLLCAYKSKNVTCSGKNDVVCLNGACVENARCDGIKQCLHGEDEYWCSPNYDSLTIYRLSKTWKDTYHIILPTFASLVPTIRQHDKSALTAETKYRRGMVLNTREYRQNQDGVLDDNLFVCNRGIAIYSQPYVWCFCPPAYYGNQCEFFSDRLTIITNLDLSTLTPTLSSSRLFKIVASLVFLEKYIDHHIFYVNPMLETKNYVKQRFYLLYSRAVTMLKHKQWRYLNRTDVVNNHPYSVHFDIYALQQSNDTIELGSFRYPIYFDYLPAFRLATVLKFPSWFGNSTLDPCAQNSCNADSTCKPILNKERQFYCSCKSGYSGDNCTVYEQKCSSYCSLHSICRPGQHGLIRNPDNPLCICLLDHFGPSCHIRNEGCKSNPCGLNGTCHLTYDPSGDKPIICECSKQFYGDRCQYVKVAVAINVNMTSAPSVVSVVQFYDLDRTINTKLALQHQTITTGLPLSIRYYHDQEKAPFFGLLKIYQGFSDSQYYILYVQWDSALINITSTPRFCPSAVSLLPKGKLLASPMKFPHNFLVSDEAAKVPSLFRYHHICRNDSHRLCFHDTTYFCFCLPDNALVACMIHDSVVDRCDFCLSGGKCIKGDLANPKDFICLCPHCHQGRLCEFSMQAFGFTFDSLLASQSKTAQAIYIALTFLLFAVGLLNNLCSFLTFKRQEPRKFTVGNYLFVVSILNQCALLCLFFKFVHVLLGTLGWTTDASCKVVSYLLSTVTRSSYWLTSWITVDRLLMVLFPTSTTTKNPSIGIYISIVTILALFGMHTHEILFYAIIRQPESSILLCVTNFQQSIAANYDRVSTLLHYFVPFFLQAIAITVLIVQIARKRAKTAGERTTFGQVLKKQFNTHKELYMTPAIIVLSALPQIIISFSLACMQLSVWQRHTLIVAYLFSYVPQSLGFVLYVLPSSGYKKEFSETSLGKKYFKWMFKSKVKKLQQPTTKPITITGKMSS